MNRINARRLRERVTTRCAFARKRTHKHLCISLLRKGLAEVSEGVAVDRRAGMWSNYDAGDPADILHDGLTGRGVSCPSWNWTYNLSR